MKTAPRLRVGIDARRIHDGGIGRYIREHLSWLPQEAPDCDFVALVNPRDESMAVGISRGLEVQTLRASGYNPLANIELPMVAKRLGLDLLHVPHYPIPVRLPCRLVVSVHDLIHWRFPRTRFHALYCKRMLERVRRQADLVLTVSEAVAEDLHSMAGIEESRVRVIANGVAASFAGASAIGKDETQVLLRRLRLKSPYAVNVTNGQPHKGVDLLIGAMRRIRGLQLVLLGQDSDRAEVRAMVAAAGLGEERICILGTVSEREMLMLYSGARLAVVASRYEGFGLPALEAMAAGVPLVATRAGGLPEVVGQAGILVDSDSIAPLAQAIYNLAFEMNDSQRESLVAEGRERAKRFTWRRTVRLTAAAYRRAMQGGAGDAAC
ncbi:MAG: glycosyltransferase family 1 protein [Deltaproteobacteria bacterium]